MPPYLQDAFTAAQSAAPARWVDTAAAALSAVCEPWILALLGLALFSWLERDVPSVLRTFAPLVAALAVGTGLAFVAGAFGGGEAIGTAVLASYALVAYGWRMLPLVAVAAAGGFVRAHAGARWVPDVVAGWALGVALGVLAWRLAARLLPERPGSA